jgi:hypothetical protein
MGLLALPVVLVRGLVDVGRAPFALAGIADSLARIARVADALREVPADDVLERLEALNANLERLASAEESLSRLATLDETLIELAGARDALVRLSETAGVLGELAAARPALERLAETSEAVDRLSHSAAVLPTIAANSRTLPALPDRMTGLEDTMDRLEASVRVLAEATAPLQGTTARLGRLVDRLPERRRAEPGD